MGCLARALPLLLLAGSAPAASVPTAAENALAWIDGRQLAPEGRGWADVESFYDRLPARARKTLPAADAEHSRNSAGLCFRFTCDSDILHVRWTLRSDQLALPHMPATGASGLDLYERTPDGPWRFAGVAVPSGISNRASFRLAPGREHLLYLPLYNGIVSIEFGLPQGKTLSSLPPPGKPVVFYGTSITQGACASRPGMAATAIAGRALDIPVLNLGFAGGGRMDPAMAGRLAELDPAAVVIDALWNMEPATVAPRAEALVRRLRLALPATPIVLVEDPSVHNISPTEKGRLLREVHARLCAEGIPGLHFLSNENMLGADSEGTVDGIHPNDLGMTRQAAVFVRTLAPLLAGIPGPFPPRDSVMDAPP